MTVQATQRAVQRPGGRTARVRKAVHQAVLELLHDHDWNDVSIPLLAQRSGVHQATIYRRWGTMPALLADVVAEQLARSSPMPDTGSLRGDLEEYAIQVAESLAGPLGVAIIRHRQLRDALLSERRQQLQRVLDRASERGENPPTLQELLEVVLAPLYFHMLFTRPAGADDARRLVDRLLTLPSG